MILFSPTKSGTRRPAREGKSEVPVETPEELSAAARVLAKRIARWTGNENPIDTAIPGLGLH